MFWAFKREANNSVYFKKHTSTDWDTDVGISGGIGLLLGSTRRLQPHQGFQFLQNFKFSTKVGEEFFHDLAANKFNKDLVNMIFA